MYVVTNGSIRPAWAVEAVDSLIKKMKTKGLWESLDFMVSLWMKKNPQIAKQFEREQKTVQKTRRKHAAFQNKSNRLLVSIPQEIHIFLNALFSKEIEEMGTKKFYRLVAKKYPMFKIPEEGGI